MSSPIRSSDNPNRFVYYPSHPVPDSPGGVVLASYVWADDAARWDSMDDDERYAFALRGLVALHGERILPFYRSGATQSWLRNPYVFGEAAVFYCFAFLYLAFAGPGVWSIDHERRGATVPLRV